MKSIFTIALCVFSITSFSARSEFIPHKDSYFLPYYHETKVNQERFSPLNPNGTDAKDTFIQFQFSLKYPFWGGQSNGVFLAYTQRSNWEAYDKSAYFRDNDFNPEVFYTVTFWDSLNLAVGAEHQSNGAGGANEVSWNRGYVNAKYQWDKGYIRVKPWVRFSDSTDYNPKIEDYLGKVEAELLYKVTEDSTLRFLVRNPFKKEYYEASLMFPIYAGIKGYVKYESGYGSTISNYNFSSNSYGIGLTF